MQTAFKKAKTQQSIELSDKEIYLAEKWLAPKINLKGGRQEHPKTYYNQIMREYDALRAVKIGQTAFESVVNTAVDSGALITSEGGHNLRLFAIAFKLDQNFVEQVATKAVVRALACDHLYTAQSISKGLGLQNCLRLHEECVTELYSITRSDIRELMALD